MAIFLVRHGETALNKARVVQPPATPLSERGLGQARLLAERLAPEGVERILASDLERARMTAEVLRMATGAALELDPTLQERNFGEVRGRPYAELETDVFAPGYVPPNGESWEVFHQRVDRAWERISDEARHVRGNLAVVTHGLVCLSLVERKLKLEAGLGPMTRPWGNTSLTVFDARPPWTVRILNCTAHLDSLPGDASDSGSV